MEESDVPLDTLRKKYASLVCERDAALEAAMAGSDIAAHVAFDASRLPNHLTAGNSESDSKTYRDALESLRICPACKGLGIASSVYNHMVISRTCAPCDGDGVVPFASGDQSGNDASISTAQHPLAVATGSTAPAAVTEAASSPPPLE